MPYRRKGRTVEVKKAGRWQKLKAHPSVSAAKSHIRALRTNVKYK